MAYKEHPDLVSPEEDATIWRYMDLSKFLYLLDTSKLYFSRLDHLSDMDHFEGHYTAANLLLERQSYDSLSTEDKQGFPSEKVLQSTQSALKKLREFSEVTRRVTFVNCWHLQDHESAAMWTQYVKSEDGIAIQSTYPRLIDSIREYGEYEVHIGVIKYIDFETEGIPYGNLFYPIMTKRRSFEHDRELRAFIWTLQHGKNNKSPELNKYKDVFGIGVPVDLKALIERIYLAPTAPEWLEEILSSVVDKP